MDKNKYYLPPGFGINQALKLIAVARGYTYVSAYEDVLKRSGGIEGAREFYEEAARMLVALENGIDIACFNADYLNVPGQNVAIDWELWTPIAAGELVFVRIPYEREPQWYSKEEITLNFPHLLKKEKPKWKAEKPKREPNFVDAIKLRIAELHDASVTPGKRLTITQAAYVNAYETVLELPELKEFIEGWNLENDMRGDTFESELQHILNKYGIDGHTSTPDYILADMVKGMLNHTYEGRVMAGGFVPLSKKHPDMVKHEKAPVFPKGGVSCGKPESIYTANADKMFESLQNFEARKERHAGIVQELVAGYGGAPKVAAASIGWDGANLPIGGHCFTATSEEGKLRVYLNGEEWAPISKEVKKGRFFFIQYVAVFDRRIPFTGEPLKRGRAAKGGIFAVSTAGSFPSRPAHEERIRKLMYNRAGRKDFQVDVDINGVQEVSEQDYVDFIKG